MTGAAVGATLAAGELRVPTPGDAKARRLVVVPGGRTGRIVYVPVPGKRGRAGRLARVVMPSGAFLSFPLDAVGVLPDVEGEA